MEVLDGTRIICKVCSKSYSKYACPRCFLRYCSLSCYKQHGEGCTEGFYRDQAGNELRGRRAGDEERQKMADILSRLKLRDEAERLGGVRMYEKEEEGAEGEGLEGEAEEDEHVGGEDGAAALLSAATLARLLAKLDVGEDVGPSDLTESEWKNFERAIAAGRLSHLVDEYAPWWLTTEAREIALTPQAQRRIQPLATPSSSKSESESDPVEDLPAARIPDAFAAPLPPLASLTKVPPSSLLRWSLVDLLYGYCFIQRRRHGDIDAEDAPAALSMLLAVSEALSPARPGSDVTECVTGLLERTVKALGMEGKGWKAPRATALALLSDTAAVLDCGRAATLCALADLDRLLIAAGGQRAEGKSSKKLEVMRQKLRFLACWANEADEGVFERTAIEVQGRREELEGAGGAS